MKAPNIIKPHTSLFIKIAPLILMLSSLDSISGEKRVLRPPLGSPSQEIESPSARHSLLPATVSLWLPAPDNASAPHKELHFHTPPWGRRALLSQPLLQHLKPEHLYFWFPKTPASQGVHPQPGLWHLAAYCHPGASAKTSATPEVKARKNDV